MALEGDQFGHRQLNVEVNRFRLRNYLLYRIMWLFFFFHRRNLRQHVSKFFLVHPPFGFSDLGDLERDRRRSQTFKRGTVVWVVLGLRIGVFAARSIRIILSVNGCWWSHPLGSDLLSSLLECTKSLNCVVGQLDAVESQIGTRESNHNVTDS